MQLILSIVNTGARNTNFIRHASIFQITLCAKISYEHYCIVRVVFRYVCLLHRSGKRRREFCVQGHLCDSSRQVKVQSDMNVHVNRFKCHCEKVQAYLAEHLKHVVFSVLLCVVHFKTACKEEVQIPKTKTNLMRESGIWYSCESPAYERPKQVFVWSVYQCSSFLSGRN
jgi:hypothetical protein